MRTRVVGLVLLLAAAGCSGGGDDDAAAPRPTETTDAACAGRIPDEVFTTLGWSPASAPEATVRGCHRETEQGYVEVRDRTGYDRLCATLDRTGGVGPGVAVDWLDGLTACAVEPSADVGQTRVVVRGEGGAATVLTVAALTSTPQAQVRAAVALLARPSA